MKIPLKELGMVMEKVKYQDLRHPTPREMTEIGSHGYNLRITEEENLVLEVDEERLAKYLYEGNMKPEGGIIEPWKELHQEIKLIWINEAQFLIYDLPNLCKITKGTV